MKKPKTHTIDTRLFKPLKARAKKERRSESQIAEAAIAEYLGVVL